MMTKLNKILICITAVLAIVVCAFGVWNYTLRNDRDRWKHNYNVVQDTVTVLQTKYDETLFEKGSLILKKSELESELDISNKKVKEYEKLLHSKLAYITKLEAQLKIKDTVVIKKIIKDTTMNSFTMRYRDKWIQFGQDISFETPSTPISKLYDLTVKVPLTVGLTDNYTIFVTSPNPYFTVTSIEGAVIDGSRFAKEPPRWSFGAYIGFGLGYGLITQQIDIGPQAGVGIEYRF